ncbi:MAG: hypothetical protein U0800_26120 [Isosphaeraceae bacterium]
MPATPLDVVDHELVMGPWDGLVLRLSRSIHRLYVYGLPGGDCEVHYDRPAAPSFYGPCRPCHIYDRPRNYWLIDRPILIHLGRAV